MANFSGEGVGKRNRFPVLAGTIALLLGNDVSAQDASVSRAEFQARWRQSNAPGVAEVIASENELRINNPELWERRREEQREGERDYERRLQTDPSLRRFEAFCATIIRPRLLGKNARTVEEEFGTHVVSNCVD